MAAPGPRTERDAPRVLLLAAGRSSRFGRPKQTAPLGPTGGSLLAYGIVDALRAGFGEAVLVTTAELEPAIREHLADVLGPDAPVRFAHQRLDDLPAAFAGADAGREKPWGTAHAVLSAAADLEGAPFAVANADDWYGPGAWRALARELERGGVRGGAAGAGGTAGGSARSAGALPAAEVPLETLAVGYPVRGTLSPRGGVSRGWMEVDEEGHASTVLELTGLRDEGGRIRGRAPDGRVVTVPDDALVSMNLWGFRPGFLRLLERGFLSFLKERAAAPGSEYALSTAVDRLVAEGTLRLRVLPDGGEWFGVTHPGDAEEVGRRLEALHAAGTYSTPLSATPA